MRFWLPFIVACSLIFTIPGCSSGPSTEELLAAATAAKEKVAAELDIERARAETAEAALAEAQARLTTTTEPAALAALQRRIAALQDEVTDARKSTDVLSKIDNALATGAQALRVSTNPDGSLNVTGVAETVGGLVGGPLGMGIAAAGSLLALFWKHRQAKTAREDFTALLKGIDRASIADATLNSSLNNSWNTIAEGLSRRGQQIVNTTSST